MVIARIIRERGRAGSWLALLAWALASGSVANGAPAQAEPRERILFDEGWRFKAGDDPDQAMPVVYDVRPPPEAPATPDAATKTEAVAPAPVPASKILKPWILPAANRFIADEARRFARPVENPGDDLPYTRTSFDDHAWAAVDLPHDWAIAGPFIRTGGGGMGRLPSAGVGWYRKKFTVAADEAGRSLFLDFDGAMSYTMVWLNGQLVGGWPYGYASWRVDLTPWLKPGAENQLAVRLDNPPNSSRWYPGAGIYRHVWLVKTSPVHVAQWGTYLTTPQVSPDEARIDLRITVDNDSGQAATVGVATEIFALDAAGQKSGRAVAQFAPGSLTIAAGGNASVAATVSVAHPKLWGPPPQQRPNRYVAVTTLMGTDGKRVLDRYETPFGIRTLRFDPEAGFFINGEHILINGVCDHHDLGALGAALNFRALQRQLEMVQEMGANAIRTSHNPPAPELLDLADRMGLLVMDEAFDVWVRQKTPLDYHLIYADWHEADLRALMQRDRNHPSIILWSIGNELGEQRTEEAGAAVAHELDGIAHDADPTRPTTSAMNWAKPGSPFAAAVDVIGLNYQGAGIRGAPGQYPAFHDTFPGKLIVGSETASTVSSRGEYMFPVATGTGAAVSATVGEDPERHHVNAYELNYAPFGASPDKVFASQEQHPYVAGEFVWTGWDYLGEPTPFDSSRSSYFGIIDMAGFKKDRYYEYQAHWRPDFPMAHILPHWTWPERVGQVTPVHVFTSGDEAELFLNGRSLGRKTKGPYEYRLRWDDVVYEPGTLEVVAWRHGVKWATDTVRTAGTATQIRLAPDRTTIHADGCDLSFVTATITDAAGVMAPRAGDRIRFSVEGPGEIVATDNGDPTNFESFASHERAAFNGLCLVIIRSRRGEAGKVLVSASAGGLKSGAASIITTTAAKP